jgi:hypothetical protein
MGSRRSKSFRSRGTPRIEFYIETRQIEMQQIGMGQKRSQQNGLRGELKDRASGDPFMPNRPMR